MKSNKGIIFTIVAITFFSVLINSVILYSCLTRVQMNAKPEDQIEKNLKSSSFWNLTGTPISIDDDNHSKNWSITAATYDWCSGSGTLNDPYLIENVTIDGQGLGSCITIRNSDEYFIIRNCTLNNSGSNPDTDGGIKLERVDHGKLINNSCSDNNGNGIYLYYSEYNNLSGNILNNNTNYGMKLYGMSNHNEITGNIANYNLIGISLYNVHYSIISGNIASFNLLDGLNLDTGDSNTISGNRIYNNSDAGINIYIGPNSRIIGNLIDYNNEVGISIVFDSPSCTVSRNTLTKNNYGVYLNDSNINEISNNNLSYNDYGIYSLNCYRNNISSNIVDNNEIGIYLENTNNTDILGNYIINNTDIGIHLVRSNGNNIFDNDLCSNANNYWPVFQEQCEGNKFRNNKCWNYPENGPPIEIIIIILISIVGAVFATGMYIFRKKSLKEESRSRNIFSSHKLKKEIRKTEAEVSVEKESHICLVHRGKITGAVYICPECETYYCMKCANVLKEKGETCWVCHTQIDL